MDFSNNQIKRAGKILKNKNSSVAEKQASRNLIEQWQATFSPALNELTAKLNTLLDSQDLPKIWQSTSRIKRMPTIIDKLNREPKMSLATMTDIVGCRYVFDTHDPAMLNVAKNKIQEEYPTAKIRDYVSNPKKSGYRAIHIIVEEQNKKIEIQLRTILMHLWADSVETVSGLSETNYKVETENPYSKDFKEYSEIIQQYEKNPTQELLNKIIDRHKKIILKDNHSDKVSK